MRQPAGVCSAVFMVLRSCKGGALPHLLGLLDTVSSALMHDAAPWPCCSWDVCAECGTKLSILNVQVRLHDAWTQWKVDAAERHQEALLAQEEVSCNAPVRPAHSAPVSAEKQISMLYGAHPCCMQVHPAEVSRNRLNRLPQCKAVLI